MKKILISIGNYDSAGGQKTYLNELFGRLSKDNCITVLTCSNKVSEVKDDRFDYVILDAWILKSMFPIPKPTKKNISRLYGIWNKNFDVVITQIRFYIPSLIGYLYSISKKKPHVHIEHSSNHIITNNYIIDHICKIYDHTIGSLILKHSNVNVGVSNSVCNFMKHLGAKRTVVIPNSVDTSFFKMYNNKNFNKKDTTIVFIGRLVYLKGVQDLIHVFIELKKSYDIRLLIVGDGPYEKTLRDLSKDQNNIFFLGRKTRQEILDVLNSADIFVNPSYSEGMPTSVLEAASVGLPVIATNVGGTNEIIDDGINGFLINLGNKIELYDRLVILIDDKKLSFRFGKGLREKVKMMYDLNKTCVSFEKIL